ncbi:MAG: ATP-binding protein [Glaciimonas sp.]|nr:ATP-binding protein [Glaciimonas sp.]
MQTSQLPQHQILSRIVWMRTLAVIGQLVVVIAVYLGIDVALPIFPLLSVIAVLAVFNILTWWRIRYRHPVSDIELFFQLFVDVTALSALLYFSGGATNPFVSFYLPVLAVAATIFPWRLTFALTLYSFAGYSLLTYIYMPLLIHDHDKAMGYHLAGMWLNFAVSSMLITWFVTRMSATLRERDAQLALAREQHLQNERIIGLGAQAATVAHEMGTPLSTVAVITGELRLEAKRNPALAPYSDDLATIETQIAVCKTALDHMGGAAHRQVVEQASSINLSAWLGSFADEWCLHHPAIKLQLFAPDYAIYISNAPLIGQILITLLDNAAQAVAHKGSAGQINLGIIPAAFSTTLSTSVIIRVADNGIGIAPDILHKLGNEPVPSMSDGRGIGVMLAFANARLCGATINLSSTINQGTVAEVTISV